MKPLEKELLPKSLQEITKIKQWYKASEYKNMVYLDAHEEFFRDWGEFEDWAVNEDNNKEVIWLYGTTQNNFYVPSAEELLAEKIEEDTFEEAWDRVKEECKEELIIIESAIQCLADKMQKLNIIGYTPDYRVGVVDDDALLKP